jgi:hypothetical protein
MTSENTKVGVIVDIINGGSDVTVVCKSENGGGLFTIEFDKPSFREFHDAIEQPLGKRIAYDGEDITILGIGS